MLIIYCKITAVTKRSHVYVTSAVKVSRAKARILSPPPFQLPRRPREHVISILLTNNHCNTRVWSGEFSRSKFAKEYTFAVKLPDSDRSAKNERTPRKPALTRTNATEDVPARDSPGSLMTLIAHRYLSPRSWKRATKQTRETNRDDSAREALPTRRQHHQHRRRRRHHRTWGVEERVCIAADTVAACEEGPTEQNTFRVCVCVCVSRA